MGMTSVKFILYVKQGKKKIKLCCWLVLIGKENDTKDFNFHRNTALF